MAKRKRQAAQLPQSDTSLSLPWNLAPQPTFCYGVGNLLQGVMNILSLGPTTMSYTWFRANDAAALASDARALLDDARQAHQQLLLTYPQLRKGKSKLGKGHNSYERSRMSLSPRPIQQIW